MRIVPDDLPLLVGEQRLAQLGVLVGVVGLDRVQALALLTIDLDARLQDLAPQAALPARVMLPLLGRAGRPGEHEHLVVGVAGAHQLQQELVAPARAVPGGARAVLALLVQPAGGLDHLWEQDAAGGGLRHGVV